MKTNKREPKSETASEAKSVADPARGVAPQEAPEREAFLEDAKREPKRKLLLDHGQTIHVLRNEKKFTFREIAEWFNARGFATDRSAVYRAWVLTIPKENLDPNDEEMKNIEPD